MRIKRKHKRLKLSIACLVAVATLLIWVSPSSAGTSTVKKSEEKTQEVSLDGQKIIFVKNAKGTTKIIGKPDRKTIFIKAIKMVKADSEEDARALLDELTFTVKRTDSRISVITEYPEKSATKKGLLNFLTRLKRSAYVNYYIEVPAAMSGEVSSASGDVGVAMLEGGAKVNCASGDVHVSAIGGDVLIELASGDVHVEDVGGALTVTTASGDAELLKIGRNLSVCAASGDVHAIEIGGDAEVSMVSGDLVLKGCKGSVVAGSSSGDLILLGIDGNITASASSGDITVTILPDSDKEFNLNTASGDIEVSYYTPDDYGFLLEISTGGGSISGDMAIKMEKISRKYLKGVVGSGKAVVKVSTASGDVEIGEIKK
jgi:hypothetical protein